MKFEIKGVKAHQTHEGEAFSLTLYADGKKAAMVENDGNGGSNTYWWETREVRDEVLPGLEQYARDNRQEWMEESPYAEWADWAILILMEIRDYLRLSKKAILCMEKEGALQMSKFSVPAGVDRQQVLDTVRFRKESYGLTVYFDVDSEKWVAL